MSETDFSAVLVREGPSMRRYWMSELSANLISMSVVSPVVCTTCGAEVTSELWLIVDKHERPDIWRECIDDTINIVICPYGHSTKFRVGLLLRDPDLDQLYYVSLLRQDSPIENSADSHPEYAPDATQAQQQMTLLKARLGESAPSYVSWRKITREMMPTVLAEDPPQLKRIERIAARQADRDNAASSRAPSLRKSLERLERSLRDNRKTSEILICARDSFAAATAAGDVFASIDSLRAITIAADAQAVRSGEEQDGMLAIRWRAQLIDLLHQVDDPEGLADALYGFAQLRASFLSEPDAEVTRMLPLCDEAIQIFYSMGDIARAGEVAATALRFCDYLLAMGRFVIPGLPETEVRSELCKSAIRYCRHARKPKQLYAKYHEAYADELMRTSGNGRRIALHAAARAYAEAISEVETGDVGAEVVARVNLSYGVALLEMSRYGQPSAVQAAEAALRRAAHIAPAENLRLSAIIRRNLAAALVSTDQTTEVQYSEALKILQELLQTTDSSLFVETLSTLAGLYAKRAGTTYAEKDDLARAIDAAESALKGIDPAEIKHRSFLLANLAQMHEALAPEGTMDQRAIDEAETAIRLGTEGGDLDLVLTLRASLGRHFRSVNEYARAYEMFAQAANTIETIYRTTASETRRANLLIHASELYQELVDVCLRCEPRLTLAAFQYADRSRARMYRETAGEGPMTAPDSIPASELDFEASLLAERRSLRNVLRQSSPMIEESLSPHFTDSSEARRNFVDAQLDALWNHFRTDCGASSYVARRKGEDVTWEAVTAWLRASTDKVAIVSFFVLRNRTIAFVAHRNLDDLVVLELPISQDELKELSADLEFGDRVLSEIGRRLVDPVLAAIPSSDVLYFIKHLHLHLIPMHAAQYCSEPLFCHIPIAHAISVASLIQSVDVRNTTPFTQDLKSSVVVGDPTSDLPNARDEAEAIADCIDGELLCGVAADRRTVLAHIPGAQIVHFACHSQFDVLDPEKSGFLLADGLLSAQDLAIGTLTADVVAASSCSSGKGLIMAGDELWGLPRTLTACGARSTITALWDIPDNATAPIMTTFYRLRYGHGNEVKPTKASALARAMQLGMENGHPVSKWGAFVLYGDYR